MPSRIFFLFPLYLAAFFSLVWMMVDWIEMERDGSVEDEADGKWGVRCSVVEDGLVVMEGRDSRHFGGDGVEKMEMDPLVERVLLWR